MTACVPVGAKLAGDKARKTNEHLNKAIVDGD